jgi:hypothetical protein
MLFDECRALMNAFRSKHNVLPKRWEMSTETLRQIEAHLPPLVPTNDRAATLWGIPFIINESVPVGEVRPIIEL